MKWKVMAAALSVATLAVPPALGGEPQPSDTEVTVAKSKRYVYAFGTVTPPAPMRHVRVVLARDAGAYFQRIAFTRSLLSEPADLDGDGDEESSFRTRFDRLNRGRCRVTVRYSGDAYTAASSDRKDFPCETPEFGTGTATVTSQGGSVAVSVQIAETDQERSHGLMYRERLRADKGMLFLFSADRTGGFWMKNTLIPLSIAFIDSEGTILEIQDMEPCRVEQCPSYAPSQPYRWALEVNQGAFEGWGVSPGDTVHLDR